jgi:hypothetical protein
VRGRDAEKGHTKSVLQYAMMEMDNVIMVERSRANILR